MEDWDIRELLVMIFRKKISIIVIVAMFIIAGCIYTYNYTTPMYSSNARIMLGKISTKDGEYLDRNVTISETDLTLNSSLILTYSELVSSQIVMEGAKEKLENYDISVEELIKSVTTERINTSDILQVYAKSTDPKLAKSIVEAVVDSFSECVKEMNRIDHIYTIDYPTAAESPYNIHHEKDIITFALVGSLTACVYVILCIFIDNTVKNSNEIESLLKVRTLINIPIDKKKQGELITVNDSKSIISESFKTLRTNVQFSSVDTKGSQVLLVTSCMPSEGKSYVSANLAIAFAQTGKRVVIVDSDMRRGRQCRVFNVPNRNGLSNYISNIDSNGYEINWSLGEYIKKTHISNLDIITAGSVPPNPAELLASARLAELIDDLKKYYDVIIFDGAPILPITDSLLLGRIIEKVMLVAVYNKTKKDNLVKAKESIEDVGGKVIGIVLNKVSMDSGSYNDGYYYYGESEKGLTRREKIEKALKGKAEKVKVFFKNEFRKVKSFGKRLSPAKTTKEIAEAEKVSQLRQKSLEEKRIEREIERMKKDEERKRVEEEKRKLEEAKAAEKAKLQEIRAEEKAKKEAEIAKMREAERIKREEQAKFIAQQKAKEQSLKMEQAKKVAEERAKEQAIREAQAKKVAEAKAKEQAMKIAQAKKAAEEKAKIEAIRAEERARFEAIRAKEKAKQEALKAEERARQEAMMEEEARIMAEEKAKEDAIMAEEMLKLKQEEAKRRQEALLRREEERRKNAELKAKKKVERAEKFNDLRGSFLNKKDEIREELKIRKAEYANRYSEYKIRKQEEKILAAEEKAKRAEELAKAREEERIRREEERKKAAEERARRLAELEAEKAEKLAKQAEEKAKREAELAKKEAELARLREAEKLRKEEEKRIAAEEKAKQIAILAEEKAKREAEAKLTDEYLQENLYPKTKYNKF